MQLLVKGNIPRGSSQWKRSERGNVSPCSRDTKKLAHEQEEEVIGDIRKLTPARSYRALKVI